MEELMEPMEPMEELLEVQMEIREEERMVQVYPYSSLSYLHDLS